MTLVSRLCQSWSRISAVVLRYLYLMRGSWPRIIDQMYWPTVQMIIWGLVTKFFASNSTWVAQAAGILIAAVLLWDVLFRSQLGVSVTFMEELYARNLGHLFASPLRPYELVSALILVSAIRTVVGVGAAAVLAIFMYKYSIFAMGLPLLAFFTILLVFGWAIGLVICSALLRYGLGVESLAWASIFALAPISGIYYPISILPVWAQPLAWIVPTSHVFEGMREVLISGHFNEAQFARGALLTVVYVALGVYVFLRTFRVARERGLLLQVGE